ncbi:glucose-6-phosphate dehydrogenase [Planococcus shenhongbingii]|uniref:glucose-6-phosphate dehydrogenase n=1 Tax=Planococcus shenhongbingii TaxID=3058398 RepID=UPI00260DB468|nr:glucose-6-phosphate dehydrogenase [Planococcus sp. N016]WKA60524.1 glucose-6-phosphate dehydrogenase [Planococcus sp. N016]
MTFILFGATGDLAKRKLFPALYNLYLDGKLPASFSVIGLGRKYSSDEDFQAKVEKALRAYSRRSVQLSNLQEFLAKFRYFTFDATIKESYTQLLELVETQENELGIPQNRLFYLSVAPSLVDVITTSLHSSGLDQNRGWKRLIIEKPFGSNVETARQLNQKLRKTFSEDEIYRIDHYLGKPMVQSLNTLILANPVLDSMLDQKLISNVQITASEIVGVETRADYYDKAGAIRDMVQNHLLQLVMTAALYLPENLTDNKTRAKKTEIIESLRPIPKEEAHLHVVRGQYEAGEIHDTPVIGYKEEPGVDASSQNDTYFAARLAIDHPDWEGIPFYIRTGKRLNKKSTQIVVEFKHKMVDSTKLKGTSPNLLVLEISPNESISLRVNLKEASGNQFKPVWINFSTNSENQPESYELLLFDAILGDPTFFAHWREVELSWEWIEPLLNAYQEDLLPLQPYRAGSTGPEAAEELLQEDQHKWW